MRILLLIQCFGKCRTKVQARVSREEITCVPVYSSWIPTKSVGSTRLTRFIRSARSSASLYISFKLSLSNHLHHPAAVLLTFLVIFTSPLDFTLQDGACQGALRSQPTSKPSDHPLRNDFQQDFVLTISSLTLLCISTHGVLLVKCTYNSILWHVFFKCQDALLLIFVNTSG